MNWKDIVLLLALGAAIWIGGTIYYAFRGPEILQTTSLRYWLAFALSLCFRLSFASQSLNGAKFRHRVGRRQCFCLPFRE